MSEFIGKRISLVSKSDIRYVGTLHEINSDSLTVALENVTSYGTEGRKGNPAEEIPGSDNVYEYIVFRGSDVKDLNIVNEPGEKENQPPKMPDDPAILNVSVKYTPSPSSSMMKHFWIQNTSVLLSAQNPCRYLHVAFLLISQYNLHLTSLGLLDNAKANTPTQSTRPPPQSQPPQQPPNQNQYRGPQPPYPPQQQFGYQGPPGQFPNQPRFQGPGGPHGFPGTPGAVPGYGQGFGGPPPPGYGMGYGPPPGQGFHPGPPPGHFNQNQQMPIGPPGQHMNQQRPPQQMQGQHPPPIGSNQSTPQPGPQMPPPQPQEKPVEMSATPGPSEFSTGPPPPVDSKASMAAATAPSAATQAQQQTTKPLQKTNSRVAVPLANPNVLAAKPPQKPTTAATAAAATVAPPTGQPQSIQDATQAATAAVAAAMAKLGPMNQNQAKAPTDSTDNLAQKVNQMRLQDNQNQRGRGRGRGGPPRGGRRDSAQRAVEVPKEDFDFESSNAKFDKEKLAEEANPTTSPIGSPNGDAPDPLAATNGHVNGTDGDDVVIPPSDKSYDKKSSFFDNISSDLKDRIDQAKDDASPVDGRAMRTQERTKNMETFGQGSVDGGYRGGYRGRGRSFGNYRGRGGGGYRGGRGGFEYRGAGYRGRGGRGGQEATFV